MSQSIKKVDLVFYFKKIEIRNYFLTNIVKVISQKYLAIIGDYFPNYKKNGQ